MTPEQERLMIEAAQAARANSYSPYSGYKVGAAILSESGQIFAGTNVENASFGATICAERGALMSLVASGHHRVCAIVVTTPDRGVPCGVCLQMLSEFVSPDTPVVLVGDDMEPSQRVFCDFLPQVFESDRLPQRHES
jgi:cytidine deaminase